VANPNPVKWSLEAEYLQACNCDYGCPCEFEAPPTLGYCEGLGAYHITRGRFGDISLDGLGFAFVLRFPAAMHKGNGTGGWFVDQRASDAQRQAFEQIFSGKCGGMPFEVFPILFSKMMPTQYAPFQFTINGQASDIKVGDAILASFESIRNPVTGQPEKIRIEHETGFIFKGADCVSAKESHVATPLIQFDWPGKAGFVTQIKYGN
jgi:hypothetical protein